MPFTFRLSASSGSLSRRHLLAAGALAATGLLAACAAPPAAENAAGAKPKLVVLLVVDGLPQRQVVDYRAQLAPDGLNRLLDRGAWFSQAHYGHAFTVTAAGHATMLTGAYPHRSGIIGNDWKDIQSGAEVYCTMDTSARYIGHATKPLDGTSPRNLRAETVGDVLKRASPQSKVIGISGKDRGAILPAGKTGTAYMYMSASGGFASSTAYMAQHPAWVNDFNAAKPADRYFRQQWLPLLPEAAYAGDVPDAQPWFAKGPNRLPMDMADADQPAPTPAFYASLLRSPFADALALDFARAAIVGEQLGQRGVTDVLTVSLSGHDYVNHAFSAESRLSHDHLLQLDRLFQAFFRSLDNLVGADNYVVVFTADHGFQPAPEVAAARGATDTGRIALGPMRDRLNAGLAARFGPGQWVAYSGSSLLVNRQLVAAQGRALTTGEVAEAARQLVLAEPGIAAAYTSRELLAGAADAGGADAPYFQQMRRSWHPEVSGDVQFTVKPNWMVGSSGATHGSPHSYDTNVPVALYGPRWVVAGRIDAPVQVVDIAPTLAGILGIPVPSSAEGQPLPIVRPDRAALVVPARPRAASVDNAPSCRL